MLTKKQLLNSLKDLPERFRLDELIDRVVLLQKIEVGLEQSKSGQTQSTDEAKDTLRKWMK